MNFIYEWEKISYFFVYLPAFVCSRVIFVHVYNWLVWYISRFWI